MSSAILKYFMKRLKEIRLQSTMTANAVAEHLGILYRTYQKYETGEIDPPLLKQSPSPISSTCRSTTSSGDRMIQRVFNAA